MVFGFWQIEDLKTKVCVSVLISQDAFGLLFLGTEWVVQIHRRLSIHNGPNTLVF